MGSKKQKTEIDFSKYRTPELIETISNIISLPGALKSIFMWAFYGLLGLVFVVSALLYFTGNMTFLTTAITELYAIPAGTVDHRSQRDQHRGLNRLSFGKVKIGDQERYQRQPHKRQIAS